MECFKKMQILVVRFFFIVVTMTLGITSLTYAASGLPYTFHSGQTISSDQVNANFQWLLTQIQAQQQASIVGTYNYVQLGVKVDIPAPDGAPGTTYTSQYVVAHTNSTGTLIFAGNGTFTSNETGGNDTDLSITNVVVGGHTSQIMGTLYSTSNLYSGGGTYTVSGSTITAHADDGSTGVFTLSADGNVLAGMIDNGGSKSKILVGIRQQ